MNGGRGVKRGLKGNREKARTAAAAFETTHPFSNYYLPLAPPRPCLEHQITRLDHGHFFSTNNNAVAPPTAATVDC